MARWWSFCLVALCACTARAGDLSGRLRIQAGQEYDSNAPREYGLDTSSDFLTRLIWQGHLEYRSGEYRSGLDMLGLKYLGGAKIFYQKTDNSEVATQIHAIYRHRLPHQRSTGLRLILKDITQVKHTRDYTLIQGEAFLRMRLAAPLTLETWVGGRDFFFKRDREAKLIKFSNLGPTLGLRIHADLGRSWSAWLMYVFDVRFYDEETHSGDDEVRDRQDLRYAAGLGARFQTHWWKRHRIIVRTSYFMSYNDSNSDDSSAVWHRLRAVLSMQFPLEMTLHLMGTLQFSDYLDGFYVEYNYYEPDADENENSFVVRLTYRLWQDLDLLLQAAVYRNEFHSSSTEQQFERETFMLGVAWGSSY